MDASGKTIEQEYLKQQPAQEQWSSLIFPQEQPPPRDFRLWEEALQELTHRGGTYQQLGDFSEKGHKIWDWRYDVNKHRLYQIKKDRIDIYEQEHTGIRQLRQLNKWRQRRSRAR
jgi:hypothetical protein